MTATRHEERRRPERNALAARVRPLAAWGRAHPRLAAAAAVVSIALLAWAVYGSGYAGYDQLYALMWGDDLAEGRLPGYEAPRAPTPHPLANLLGLALAPLGDGSLPALKAISLLSFGALAVAAHAVGTRVASSAVGALFAALVLTRAALVNQAMIASIDVPFLALVLAAAAIELRRPRAGVPVLLVLGVAGLLRPEAWLLAAAYLAWTLPAARRERVVLVAVAAVPPLLWMLSDLWVTGDATWSFHQARATAERLGEHEDLLGTLAWTARSWKGLLHAVPALGAIAGLVYAVRVLRRRAAVPLVLLALGTASFLAIGFARLPLLTRYFFMPATMLALFAAVGALGWRELAPGHPERRLWRAAGLVLCAALVVDVPFEVDHLHGAQVKVKRAQRLQNDLRAIAEVPRVRELIPRCQPVQTRLFRARPTLIWARRDDPPARVVATRTLDLTEGMLLIYRLEERPPPASSFTEVARNRTWTVLAHCRG